MKILFGANEKRVLQKKGCNSMKLGDIYINKKDNSIIQIDSFATHMGNLRGLIIAVFSQLEINADRVGSCPSFNGYGSRAEIELDYDLLIPYEKLDEETLKEALESRNNPGTNKNSVL